MEKILVIFFLAVALDALSFSMLIPINAPYVYSLEGTQFYLGVISSVCALITLVWNPIVGSLSDRLGRKTVLLYCLFICFIGNFLVVCYSSLVVFFISRVLAALGTQIMTLIKSLIDDNVQSKDEKMAVISKTQALAALLFVFGSVISGHLSELDNGIKYIFLIISMNFAINFGLISMVNENKPKQKETQKSSSFNILKEISFAAKGLKNVDWPKYWDLFVIKLITDFAFNVLQFNSGLIFTKRFQASGKTIGYLIACMSVVGITMNLSMRRLKKYLYPKDEFGFLRLLHGNFLLIIAFIGFTFSPNFYTFSVFIIPFNMARVLLETTVTEVLLLRASPNEKGSIMGTFDSTLSLAGLTAPIISGIIADNWGENVCLLSCVLPLILGSMLTYSQKIKVQ